MPYYDDAFLLGDNAPYNENLVHSFMTPSLPSYGQLQNARECEEPELNAAVAIEAMLVYIFTRTISLKTPMYDDTSPLM